MKVLVGGATGYLGKFVVKECNKRGYWVRALTRRGVISAIDTFVDDWFVGEITKEESISGICQDIDVVISTIGITKQKDGLTYMDVDYQANLNLLNEAKKSGVKKFIYISVFNAEKIKELQGIKAKLKFEHALINSGLEYTIIYPNGFFSDMKSYIQMAQNGRGYLFGNGDKKINPIHGSDLAKVCVDAVNIVDKKIEVGGPDILTHREIIELAFDCLGKKIKVTEIPLAIKNIFLVLLRTLTPVTFYGPIEFFMTVTTIDLVAPQYGNHHLRDYFLDDLAN